MIMGRVVVGMGMGIGILVAVNVMVGCVLVPALVPYRCFKPPRPTHLTQETPLHLDEFKQSVDGILSETEDT
ncbi:hypothetical protein SPBR_02153 [Sporothrix brasiliensis 5110]|uniref:Uncharacterized protein n=1 Tax=Sporothrix brasiliensis 5110 TaxID=1398154 RepID=A0A0C2J2L2_9PEZI|nr:uncharacterized protein SPBR_02153 [Sporothrix brasiliensis 5110]KIH91327.1 hypothetical protein SPBR_02153 [Sporothrix brasiliensis 5110]